MLLCDAYLFGGDQRLETLSFGFDTTSFSGSSFDVLLDRVRVG
jgi:hypothetical protein